MRLDHIILSVILTFYIHSVPDSVHAENASYGFPCFDMFIIAGGHSGEAIPVPIPNTEVKLSCADDTGFVPGK